MGKSYASSILKLFETIHGPTSLSVGKSILQTSLSNAIEQCDKNITAFSVVALLDDSIQGNGSSGILFLEDAVASTSDGDGHARQVAYVDIDTIGVEIDSKQRVPSNWLMVNGTRFAEITGPDRDFDYAYSALQRILELQNGPSNNGSSNDEGQHEALEELEDKRYDLVFAETTRYLAAIGLTADRIAVRQLSDQPEERLPRLHLVPALECVDFLNEPLPKSSLRKRFGADSVVFVWEAKPSYCGKLLRSYGATLKKSGLWDIIVFTLILLIHVGMGFVGGCIGWRLGDFETGAGVGFAISVLSRRYYRWYLLFKPLVHSLPHVFESDDQEP